MEKIKIIVVGCGRLGADLAYRLFKAGHEVVVVDSMSAAFNTLPSDFTARCVEGDVLEQDVLHRAGMDKADAIAIMTNSDALNAVIGAIAQKIYHVPTVVVRNYDPRLRDMFESFGLQVVSSTSWGAQRVEEILQHSDMRMVFSAGNGEVEVYELGVNANCNGHQLAELLGEGCVPISLTRAGKAILPDCDDILQTGDIIHFSATFEGISAVRERMRCAGTKEA
jgi:trk system potassium uptake protein